MGRGIALIISDLNSKWRIFSWNWTSKSLVHTSPCAHLVFFLCVITSLIKHLWDVSSCSVRGGTVLHQCAFIVKKNVETLQPINATTSVIPVSNLLPLCGNNFRVYKRVRFPNIVERTGAVLPSAFAVRAEPHFTPKLCVLPGDVAHGSCDYVLSTTSAARDGQQPSQEELQ